MIKSTLAFLGLILVLMWGAGSMGIGHFHIYYGGSNISCEKFSST